MGIETKPKLKLAVYWGAACGGCCVSVLDVHEKLFDVVAAADLVFWPIAMDFKYRDVEAVPDRSIDACLFSGAIRNGENADIARLLRRKSKTLVKNMKIARYSFSLQKNNCGWYLVVRKT